MENPSRFPAPPPMPPRRRNGCLTALMVVIGIVLMLPGLCVLAYGQSWAMDRVMMLNLLAGLSGVAMIWVATRDFRP